VAAIAPDSPGQLLERFQRAGWEIVDEGEFNWLVAQLDDEGGSGEPFIIPKDGGELGFEVMRKAHGRLQDGHPEVILAPGADRPEPKPRTPKI